MITYVKGKIVKKNPSYAIIETSGIGYFINISLQTYSALGNEENCKLLTYLSIKEDSHTLFGFFDSTERDVFTQLISVSGIGTNTARMMLSSLSSNEIVSAIASENVNALKGIKGIGLKTAQRVILDLKDKIGKNVSTENINRPSNNTIKNEALSALMVLGFDKKTAEGRIDAMISKNPQIKDVEELIKYSLKNL